MRAGGIKTARPSSGELDIQLGQTAGAGGLSENFDTASKLEPFCLVLDQVLQSWTPLDTDDFWSFNEVESASRRQSNKEYRAE